MIRTLRGTTSTFSPCLRFLMQWYAIYYFQVALEDEKRAAADRDLALKKATYKAEVNQAEAAAEVAFEIEKAKQGQTVSVKRALCTSAAASTEWYYCVETYITAQPRIPSGILRSETWVYCSGDYQ